MSQSELAIRGGIAQANLSKIENGKQDITVSTLLQICLALDIKASTVLDPPDRSLGAGFSRARLEKIAASVVGNHPAASKDDQQIVRLLQKTMLRRDGPRISSKAATVHWADLRQRFSNEEIAVLRQRVEDALQRKPHAKKHR